MTPAGYLDRRVRLAVAQTVDAIKRHAKPSKAQRLEKLRALAEVRKRRERESRQ